MKQPTLFDPPMDIINKDSKAWHKHPSFHNTIDLKGKELHKAESKAKTQEDLILDYFIKKDKDFTPAEVAREFPQMVLTSIRRAMSNLTKQGKLIKMHKQREGDYGKANYCWMLNKNR